MLDYIEKLRQKPEKTKVLIAFSASLLIAGTIFVIWLTVVLPDIRQDQVIKDKIAKIEPSPLSTFFDNVANSFSALKGKVDSVKSKVTDIASSTVYYEGTSTNQTSSQTDQIYYQDSMASTTTETATSSEKVVE